MKIGFDLSQTGSLRAGCGFYADTLMRSLVAHHPTDEFLLYKTFGTTYWDPDYQDRIQMLEADHCQYLAEFGQLAEARAFWGHPSGVDEAKIGCPDIVHANNFSSPRFARARLVYTVYDLSFIDLPECTTEANRQVCFNGMLEASLWADLVVAISSYSRQRFLEVFPHFPADRAVVAHLGNRLAVDGALEAVADLDQRPFLLAVGTLEPRKNLRRLLKAYQRYSQRMADPKPLALAGGKGWLEGDLKAYIEALGIQDHVYVLGYVSDAALRWLYQHCWAFIYPSRYEGFGLPVLEAMSAGAATITSRVTSLPEVGGEAALYVDPMDEDSILAALLNLEGHEDYRQDLRRQCLAQAQRFSWENTAQAVYQAYQTVLDLPPRPRPAAVRA